MFAYATDNTVNNNGYPNGNTSTEVFQKLIDGGYVTDPAIFYVPLPGKIRAVAGQKLKPENVCWDVTSGAGSDSPDGLPLIFMTGYKVTYVPGGSAVPIIKSHPPFWTPRIWSEWWNGDRNTASGIAVFYTGNNAAFIRLGIGIGPDNTIQNFVSPKFKPDGKTYRQLTPDGVLPSN